jgi:hypothetical protein
MTEPFSQKASPKTLSANLKRCKYGGYSCIACIQDNPEQLKQCYPLLGQNPPHPDRFKHRDELP